MNQIKYADDKTIQEFKNNYGRFALPEAPLYAAGYEIEQFEDGKKNFYQITAHIEDINFCFSKQPIEFSRWHFDLNEVNLIGNEETIQMSELADIEKSMDCLFSELFFMIDDYLYKRDITRKVLIDKCHQLYKGHLSRFLSKIKGD